jgi:ABC-type nickel/cobalt efflux system permease component RcnA
VRDLPGIAPRLPAVSRILPFFLLALSPAPTRAHDIPNARVDRSIQATLEPGRLRFDYEVSLSELTLTRDLRMLLGSGSLPGVERRDWFALYGRETGPLNARGLLVTSEGRPVDVRFLGFDLDVEEHPRFVFHLEASGPFRGRLTIQDTNYAGSEGTSRLAVRGREGVTIRGDDLPGDVESIPIRPVWQLTEDQERRTRQVAVDVESPDEPRAGGTAPPELAPPAAMPQAPPSPASPARRERGFGPSRLTRLLDGASAAPSWGLILLALGLGAVHALQPGHGKTLVAAGVLGEHGTWFRGFLLGLLITLTHTGSVLLVAVGLWATQSVRYGSIHRGLAHAAGFVIAAIGLWRLGRHLAGHGEHSHGPAPAPPSGGLVGLGVAGGLVPCWDAVVLIVLAEAIGRLALGLVLLIAFGLGMALVLVAVGWLAARVRGLLVPVQGGDADSYGPWERRLGIASGLALSAIGVYLLGIS